MNDPDGKNGNGKWILRELTAIKVKLDNLSEEFRYVKNKIEQLDTKAIQLETSYERLLQLEKRVEKLEMLKYGYEKIEEFERKIDRIEKEMTEHNVKIDELFKAVKSIKQSETFRSKLFWNFVTLTLASVLASLIVLAIKGG